jgi:hypothetical protein
MKTYRVFAVVGERVFRDIEANSPEDARDDANLNGPAEIEWQSTGTLGYAVDDVEEVKPNSATA